MTPKEIKEIEKIVDMRIAENLDKKLPAIVKDIIEKLIGRTMVQLRSYFIKQIT